MKCLTECKNTVNSEKMFDALIYLEVDACWNLPMLSFLSFQVHCMC